MAINLSALFGIGNGSTNVVSGGSDGYTILENQDGYKKYSLKTGSTFNYSFQSSKHVASFVDEINRKIHVSMLSSSPTDEFLIYGYFDIDSGIYTEVTNMSLTSYINPYTTTGINQIYFARLANSITDSATELCLIMTEGSQIFIKNLSTNLLFPINASYTRIYLDKSTNVLKVNGTSIGIDVYATTSANVTTHVFSDTDPNMICIRNTTNRVITPLDPLPLGRKLSAIGNEFYSTYGNNNGTFYTSRSMFAALRRTANHDNELNWIEIEYDLSVGGQFRDNTNSSNSSQVSTTFYPKQYYIKRFDEEFNLLSKNKILSFYTQGYNGDNTLYMLNTVVLDVYDNFSVLAFMERDRPLYTSTYFTTFKG